MPCYDLRPAVQVDYVNPKTGKSKYIFLSPEAVFKVHPSKIEMMPCKQCHGCRLRKSAEWAARCMHERSLHDSASFLTLTYKPERLPANGSLVMRHYQLFMKSLREKFDNVRIRFYHSGEYGDKLYRPHYHALIFGFDFPDKVYWKTHNGNPLYLSPSLQKLWKLGYSSIGNVTFKSAAYVARYAMKKINGLRKEEHYRRIDPVTGKSYQLAQEYSTMSRKPGIAKRWIEKYFGDVYPHDYVIVDGRKMKPPSFYDSYYEMLSPDDYVELKLKRKELLLKHIANNTPERMIVREKCERARTSLLIRNVE